MAREVIYAEDLEKIFGKRPWVSRAQEIINENEANVPTLDDRPDAVKQAVAEHQASLENKENNE